MKFLIKWGKIHCNWHSDCCAVLWAAIQNSFYPPPFLVLVYCSICK